MPPITLSWPEAEVKDAELTVPLDGDVPKGWKQSFERTVALLGHGDWGEISVKKDRLVVRDVTPGSEAKLKHHLEGVVAQANATLDAAEDGESEEPDDGERALEQDSADQRRDPDAEMTERFRSD
jgi:hypothetical protein